jgi:hypothetical protein
VISIKPSLWSDICEDQCEYFIIMNFKSVSMLPHKSNDFLRNQSQSDRGPAFLS